MTPGPPSWSSLGMFRGSKVAVVIPAYNEADKIAAAIRSVPGFVDHILVVDDASTDGTGALAQRIDGRRSVEARQRAARSRRWSTRATAAAAPRSRPGTTARSRWAPTQPPSWRATGRWIPPTCARLLLPVVTGAPDYAKGHRFARPGYWRAMPVHRLVGNVALSLLTRLSSGYLRIFDSQCGYTVASRRARCWRSIPTARCSLPLRLSERPARAAAGRGRARGRRAGAPDLRRRLALGDPRVPKSVILPIACRSCFARFVRRDRAHSPRPRGGASDAGAGSRRSRDSRAHGRRRS